MTDTPQDKPFDAKREARRLVGHTGIADGIAAALQRVHDAGAEGMRERAVDWLMGWKASVDQLRASAPAPVREFLRGKAEALSLSISSIRTIPLTPKTTPMEGHNDEQTGHTHG